jgi:hypothetical protein
VQAGNASRFGIIAARTGVVVLTVVLTAVLTAWRR